MHCVGIINCIKNAQIQLQDQARILVSTCHRNSFYFELKGVFSKISQVAYGKGPDTKLDEIL